MTQVIKQDFPKSEEKVRRLIADHLKLTDEPLALALYFSPDRQPQDIFVFEVIDGFGADAVDPEQNLFEVTYKSTVAFPLEQGQELHLVLTNRKEVEIAFRDGWESALEIRQAVRNGEFRTIHLEPTTKEIMELIRGQ